MGKRTIKATEQVVYHGRKCKPEVHLSDSGRPYVMRRVSGGGTGRLYLDTKTASSHVTSGLSHLREQSRKLKKRLR